MKEYSLTELIRDNHLGDMQFCLPNHIEKCLICFNNQNSVNLWKFNNDWYMKKMKIDIHNYLFENQKTIVSISF